MEARRHRHRWRKTATQLANQPVKSERERGEGGREKE